jgi:single stranded DNA-binding protein
MSSLNQIMLIGNLGKDPEVLQTTELGSFVRIVLATDRKFKTKTGEVREDTQWHTVYLNYALGKVAAPILKKGAKIYVSGELRTRDWQSRSGQVHRFTAVYAREIKFLCIKLREADVFESADEESLYEKAKREIDYILSRAAE